MSVAVATAVAAVAAVAASVGMWAQEVGCWVLEPAAASCHILGLVLISDHPLECLLDERWPEVVMNVLHLCSHPVGPGCPGVGVHLHQFINSSLQPLRPINLLCYGPIASSNALVFFLPFFSGACVPDVPGLVPVDWQVDSLVGWLLG